MKKAWILLIVFLLCTLLLCACGAPAERELPVDQTAAPAESPSALPAEPTPTEIPVEESAAPTEPVEQAEEPTEEPAEASAPAEPPASDPPAPEPTPMPTPEPGQPRSLSAEEQYEANIFLSNFSEQGFGLGRFAGFDSSEAGEAQLFSFAHLWAKINRHDAISYKDSYETMTLEDVNDILGRFFALTIQPEEGTDYSAELGIGNFDWNHCWYEGGVFYYPGADGESHTGFTVVDAAESLPGSRTRFRFTAYELNLDIYYDNLGIPQTYYRLTPEEAVQRMAAGEITPIYTGTAVCEPCYLAQSGRESYILDSYLIDEVD